MNPIIMFYQQLSSILRLRPCAKRHAVRRQTPRHSSSCGLNCLFATRVSSYTRFLNSHGISILRPIVHQVFLDQPFSHRRSMLISSCTVVDKVFLPPRVGHNKRCQFGACFRYNDVRSTITTPFFVLSILNNQHWAGCDG